MRPRQRPAKPSIGLDGIPDRPAGQGGGCNFFATRAISNACAACGDPGVERNRPGACNADR
ncbi:MAG: hypothetical protein IH827_10590 [Myxococcales bacterium]|nr:hypothetical protein [Myxococcales bacterium]